MEADSAQGESAQDEEHEGNSKTASRVSLDSSDAGPTIKTFLMIFLSSEASAVPIHSSLSFVLFPFDASLRKRLQCEMFRWRKSVSLSPPPRKH